jgi:hypothetical protein
VAATVLVVVSLVTLATDGTEHGFVVLGLGLQWYGISVTFLPRDVLGMEARDGALVVPVSRLRAIAPLAGTAAFTLGWATIMEWPAALLAPVAWGVGVSLGGYRHGMSGEVRIDPDGVAFAYRPYRRRLAWSEVDYVAARKQRVEVTSRAGDPVRVHPARFEGDTAGL